MSVLAVPPDLSSIVPPPYEVQRRAWECALVLRQDFAHRLLPTERRYAHAVLTTAPDRLGWRDTWEMLTLFRRRVATRV